MRYYQNTITEWIAVLQQMEKAGKGDERVALAIWTKQDVEEMLAIVGYRVEMSEEEWHYYARKTEDSWSEFGEDDVEFAKLQMNLAYEGTEE